MSADEISPMAKIHAERILRGEGVTDVEMRIVTAGLMLAVDQLTNVVKGFTEQLWSEERLRTIIGEEVGTWSDGTLRTVIGEEVRKHCAGKRKGCAAASGASEKIKASRVWGGIGTLLRSLVGL